MQKKGPPSYCPAQRSETPWVSLALGACFAISPSFQSRRSRPSPRSLPRRMLAANSCGARARRCTMLSLPVCNHFWSHLDCKSLLFLLPSDPLSGTKG